jgi:hypothetical protein
MNFTKKHGLYQLIALCCVATIYFYPFLSSSITWMRNSHFRYENSKEIKLPFRWISGDSIGLSLVKPAAAINIFPHLDTSLSISDRGPGFRASDEGRARSFDFLGIVDSMGTPDEPTYPFTSEGLLCSRVDNQPTKPSEYWLIVCLSSDSRYLIQYTGKGDDIREASEIVKQVVR